MSTIVIEQVDPACLDARALIDELDAFLTSMYPAESNHLLSIESLQAPEVTFLLLRVDGKAAGCGAFVRHGDYAELKRMFVRPEYRGLKLGRRLVDELESRILLGGIRAARLETGIRQVEALALYEKAGYVRRGEFGEYAADPLSVFMEKQLGGP